MDLKFFNYKMRWIKDESVVAAECVESTCKMCNEKYDNFEETEIYEEVLELV